jgi:hypothetical protein
MTPPFVIPGRALGSALRAVRAQARANPESILPAVVMDSGLATSWRPGMTRSQASSPVLFEKAPGTPLKPSSLTNKVRGVERRNGASTAAPSCEGHGASPCDRGRCAFRRSTRRPGLTQARVLICGVLPKAPGPLFRARTGGTHHPGASAPFVRYLVQPDYRQTLVVGSGGCPEPPGADGDEPQTAGAASRSIRRRHRLTPLSEQDAVFIPGNRIVVKKVVKKKSRVIMEAGITLD